VLASSKEKRGFGPVFALGAYRVTHGLTANHSMNLQSRAVPWLSAALPLIVGWCWPRSYGPSPEAFPLLLGAFLACVAAINIKRWPPARITVWLGAVVAIAFWRGHPLRAVPAVPADTDPVRTQRLDRRGGRCQRPARRETCRVRQGVQLGGHRSSGPSAG
jgi:hypothetical protein